ncbi:hypothetical protein N0V83_002006 [Neocucurbitaria cava]|uniref:Glycosyl transferase CAP10 domain-containing protein n=1 Tax=Neocucurbitaria cava TaxID=798079 RepID=A0A9W8YEE6_9PLEO|nr:hypothetical protein N0V83_002006 [Neocucurbitaria cava]
MSREGRHCVTIRNIIYCLTVLGLIHICSDAFWIWRMTPLRSIQRPDFYMQRFGTTRSHPIEQLMAKAEARYQTLISRQTTDLKAAAASYRDSRGRHPPPGFDAWFEFARKHNAVVIEGLFDQIYRDLTPFWGISAKQMRDFAHHFDKRIYIRNGTANRTKDEHDNLSTDNRMEAWLHLVQGIEHFVPDIDMAMNVMDESRVVVPWEEITTYVNRGESTRVSLPSDEVVTQYRSLRLFNETLDEAPEVEWIGPGHFWDTVRVGCSLSTLGRHIEAATNFTGPPPFPPGRPGLSFQDYVSNWTFARDPCQHPLLQETHGAFIEPTSVSTTHTLVPIFGESKLSMNNDILIPAAAYLSESYGGGQYSDANVHGGKWSDKIAGVAWRGAASGGRNREENWTRFHRHRFVSMLNGTNVRNIQKDPVSSGEGRTFIEPSYATWDLAVTKIMKLGSWLNRIADVGFTDLWCLDPTNGPGCNYTDPYFEIAPYIAMAKQYEYKFLPDIDGSSFSGRYLAFLRSTSVPIKATIYSEWHDDRLIQWLHFVPMDNSFVDIYHILDFFLGYGDNVKMNDEKVGKSANDDKAEKIASRGKEWAQKVLRKEDMQVYMLRLLLEYARLCDDNREKLGYVGDLKNEPQ